MQKLDRTQKRQLERELKKTRMVSERNRLCVILGHDDGLSVDELAAVLRVTRATVYNYLNDFWTKDKTSEASRSGRPSKLTDHQSELLEKHLSEVTYLKVKDICAYVKSAFGVSISRAAMTSWLKSKDFVFKCPMKVPGKLNPELQKSHIEKYRHLKAVLGPDERIYFVDAVHPEHQSQATRGWIRKGVNKTLQSTGKQLRLHFAGALDLDGMNVFTREYKTVDAEAMIDFFQGLEKSTTASKIYVILDKARANKNKKLDEYLKDSRIEPIYLPPYSPNLNAIERLWKIMREAKTYNRYYESSVDFFREIRSFFNEQLPTKIKSFRNRLNDTFQVIDLNPIKPAFV
jgi:transposase